MLAAPASAPVQALDKSAAPSQKNEFPEFPALKAIKDTLAPREKGAQAQDIIKMEIAQFDVLVDYFKEVFKNFDHLGLQRIDRNINRIRERQIEAVWLYMAFSLYINNWAKSKLTKDAPQKLKSISELHNIALPLVGKVLRNVDEASAMHYSRHPRWFHQQILMISGNLFVFFRSLNIEMKEILRQMPLSIDSRKIAISRERAQEREKSRTSLAESEVNSVLLAELGKAPDPFKPIKKEISDLYVDQEMGLELDFPLMGRTAIETDGIHHLNGKKDSHNMIHNMKGFLFREMGWVRVPIEVNSYSKEHASKIARILQIPEVLKFKIEYDKLTKEREELRTIIIQLQGQFQNSYTTPSIQNLYFYHIKQLLEEYKALQEFIEKRHLEFLLIDPRLIQKALASYDSFLRADKLKKDADKAVVEVRERIEGLTSQVQEYEKEIQEKQKHISADDLQGLENIAADLKRRKEAASFTFQSKKAVLEKCRIQAEKNKKSVEDLLPTEEISQILANFEKRKAHLKMKYDKLLIQENEKLEVQAQQAVARSIEHHQMAITPALDKAQASSEHRQMAITPALDKAQASSGYQSIESRKQRQHQRQIARTPY